MHKTVVRTDLWYGKYSYKMQGVLPLAFVIREWWLTNEDDIYESCQRRKDWMQMVPRTMRPIHSRSDYHTSFTSTRLDPMDCVESLIDTCLYLQDNADYVQTVIEGDWFRLYTDEESIVNDFMSRSVIQRKQSSQVSVVGPKNAVLLKKSQYAKRCILKGLKTDDKQKSILAHWIETNDVKACPTLKEFYKNDMPWYNYVPAETFFDFNDEKLLTSLCLTLPGIVKEIKPIVIYK